MILSLARFSFHFWWGMPWGWGVVVLNSVMRGGVLILLAVITARLGKHTRALRQRVRTLEGILPICGFCKKIRDEEQAWQQLEAYISQHSEAHFSHGVCPACADQHYGGVLAKALEKARSVEQAGSQLVPRWPDR